MTEKIKAEILEVRNDGRANMFDINGVMWVANDLEFYDLVVYLSDKANRREYSHFIMTGEVDIDE